MGRCLIINITEILDERLTPVQISCGNHAATVTAVPRCTGILMSLSFYGQHKPTATPKLEKCVNNWVRLSWSHPRGIVDNNTTQVTWHRLAIFKSSDVQLMTMQFSQLSGSVNQSSEPNLKYQARAQGGPGHLPNIKPFQGQTNTTKRFFADSCHVKVTTRQKPLYAYVPRSTPPLGVNPNIGQHVMMSDTTSQTSQTQDSDERILANNAISSTSSVSTCEVHDPRYTCGATLVDVAERPDGPDPQDDSFEEADAEIDVEDQRARYPLLNPPSEYQANLDAVSQECKDLFLGLRGHVQEEIEADDDDDDDAADSYWTWSQRAQQWFHEDTECGTVIWFPKDFD